MAHGVDRLRKNTFGRVSSLVTEELVGFGEVFMLGAFFCEICDLFNKSFYFLSNRFNQSMCRGGCVIGSRLRSRTIV